MGQLFGTDGVRGVANTQLTPDLAFRLGRAGAYVLSRQVERPKIVIGKDTRISGDMLEAALMAGICSVGADVLRVGVIPTPGIAMLTRELGAAAGVVISASHNPVADNGIKFFAGNGFKLPDALEDEIESLLGAEIAQLPCPTGENIGRIYEVTDAVDRYVEYIKQTVSVNFKGLKIVVDCANGAAFEVAPRVYRELGAEVIALNDLPNGVNINDGCGSTHPDNLREAVINHGADLGLAHDGDADRVIAVDEQGRIIDGDFIMVICASDLKRRGLLQDNTLVVTVMSNLGLHLAMKREGIKIVETKVGDRYVLEAMQEQGAILGGEQSGHIIFLNHNTTGDGVITACHLASVIKQTGRSMSTLAAAMTRLPQVLVNVRVRDKAGWDTDSCINKAITRAKEQLGEQGRVLVRPSGTEPLIRVMAEGPEEFELRSVVDDICKVVKEKL